MNPQSLNEHTHNLRRRLGIRPSKSLGQNFLISNIYRDRIIELVESSGIKTIIEIGGGMGALSMPLANISDRLVIYEIDSILRNWLESDIASTHNNVEICGDFLNEYPPDNLKNVEFIVVGNIPYQITSPILDKIYGSDILPKETILMLQSEVAHRLDASVGTRERGRLTIWREYHTDVINGFNVPPGAFYPPPKVGSRVVRLATRDKFRFDAENKKRFFSMVKKSFAMKRKTLANNLQNWVPHADKKAVQDLLVEMELDFRVRAEDLGIDDFVALYERIEILR